MKRVRVAFVSLADSTFVQRDREILREAFEVRRVLVRGWRSIPRLVWSVLRSDVAFSWFAQDHAYGACRLAELLGKKSVVVVGGVDAARIPELGYGEHTKPSVAARSRYTLARSDRVLVVDDFLREEISRNAGVRRPEIVTVPLGFDPNVFRPDGGPRSNVLTAGIVTDVNVRRKGLDTFVEAARRLAELPFRLVGATPSRATERLRESASPNLTFVPVLAPDALLEEYRRARVYVQASLYEGLPSALGEAMACGCVPVGTRAGGIPSLIGDTGVFVPAGNPDALATAIRTAYADLDGSKARDRIAQVFPLERRRQALQTIIRELAENQLGRD
ncbi:MAG TPA: glycosyltransferase family 4 protein [Thermoplasmata archaeon]